MAPWSRRSVANGYVPGPKASTLMPSLPRLEVAALRWIPVHGGNRSTIADLVRMVVFGASGCNLASLALPEDSTCAAASRKSLSLSSQCVKDGVAKMTAVCSRGCRQMCSSCLMMSEGCCYT